MEKQTNNQTKNPRIAKIILNNKKTPRGITTPDFKFYHRAIVIKIAWYWHKNRQTGGSMTQIDDLDVKSHFYRHLIFDKETKMIQWKKKHLQQMVQA